MLSLSLIREQSSGNCLCYLHRSGLHSRSTVGKHTLVMVVIKIMKNRAVADPGLSWVGGALHVYGEPLGGLGFQNSPINDRGSRGPPPKNFVLEAESLPPPFRIHHWKRVGSWKILRSYNRVFADCLGPRLWYVPSWVFHLRDAVLTWGYPKNSMCSDFFITFLFFPLKLQLFFYNTIFQNQSV